MNAAAYARTLPWRRVVDPHPVREYAADGTPLADYRDVLECGHTVFHEMLRPAAKRRCYLCGQQQAKEAK